MADAFWDCSARCPCPRISASARPRQRSRKWPLVVAVGEILSGAFDYFRGDGWCHQDVAARVPFAQRKWGSLVCQRAGCAGPDISRRDYRYSLCAYGRRQVWCVIAPLRAWFVSADKMVATAGVHPSASHEPHHCRRASRIDRPRPEASHSRCAAAGGSPRRNDSGRRARTSRGYRSSGNDLFSRTGDRRLLRMPKRGIGSRRCQASEAGRIQENTTAPGRDRCMGSSRTTRRTCAALRLGSNLLTVAGAAAGRISAQ